MTAPPDATEQCAHVLTKTGLRVHCARCNVDAHVLIATLQARLESAETALRMIVCPVCDGSGRPLASGHCPICRDSREHPRARAHFAKYQAQSKEREP
jgi:hypothetical protein